MRTSQETQQAVLAALTTEAQVRRSLCETTGLSEISMAQVLIELVESKQVVSYLNPATGQTEYWLPPKPKPSQ